MASSEKMRIDHFLVKQGFAESRTKAQALILSGQVLVDEMVVDKPGALIKNTAKLRVKQTDKYVSRGGLKLEKALLEFSVNVANKICLDVGASTGGFTDCLLQRGAKKVYAVDVGYGQLHWKLQSDARVVRLDRINFRHFDLNLLKNPDNVISDVFDDIDIVVVDASFISLKLLLPKIHEVLGLPQTPHANRSAHDKNPEKYLVALVKPQFEVGLEHIGKGGIVRDENQRNQALSDIISFCEKLGFVNIQTTVSPITGKDGNVEYLLCAKMSPETRSEN